MSLHSIVEPAGTLQTGWKLSGKDPRQTDIRNADDTQQTRAVKAKTRSKWEKSADELAKIG